jgi:poly(A) polymerase
MHEDTPERRAAVGVVRTLRDAGHTAYFAGGCVRDELLGLGPTDYDVATDARPERIAELFRSTSHVGVSFGVVIVRLGARDLRGLRDRVSVEVATFRSDGPYTDRRRPDSVAFAGELDDAQRRDFTVNAVFLDPLAEHPTPGVRGRVIDHVGGLADLSARVIRAVGHPEARLAEDHLRALRGVRFAARLGFTLEPATAAAIARHAGDLAGVSPERIGDEIRRMLVHPARAAAARMLRELGLEAAAIGPHAAPGLARLAGLPAGADVPTALAAWSLDRGDNGAHLRRRLLLSNKESDDLARIIEAVGVLGRDWPGLGVAPRKRAAAGAVFGRALSIVRASDPAAAGMIDQHVRDLEASPSGLRPDPLLSGLDLIGAGFPAGPRFGPVLDRVYDAQLEDRVTTKDEALAFARSLLES